ncbi:efflux RND transporter periplasmic adaptor subunit [candidate division KSB1 bacterium]|nr:efflux RND transporter periplasmic adaptor subunit [candidate division KSB1 bacterium]
MNNMWNFFKNLPRTTWILVGVALILGLIIGNAGNSDDQSEDLTTHTHTETAEAELWTCSMHPQIKLPKPGKCPICFMDLIPLESGNDEELGLRELKLSKTSAKLAEISTVIVQRGKAAVVVRLSGKILVDERNIKTITAWVPGRLEKLFVDFTGTEVKQGDPLVELYSPALYAAQEELLQALQQMESGGIAGKSAQILVDAVREKLRQLGLTDNQIDDVEKRGTASDRLIIVSPISGVVIHKNALEGRYVDRGSQIYTIADLSQVWAVLDAYEKDIGLLSEGQTVSFEAEALPGKTFQSMIKFINPVLDGKTRSVQVRLDMPNRKGLLKPGMFIRANVDAELPKDGQNPILVPATAVLKTGKRAVVYVRKPDLKAPVFEGREVTLGPRAGDYYVVLSGLMEGEIVVVKGNFKIDSALQILAKPSMMNPEGGVVMTGHANHGGGTSSQKSSEKESYPSDISEMAAESVNVSPAFRQLLKPVYDSYFTSQEALANDQFKSARDALIDLRLSISGIQVPDGHAGHLWMDIQKEILAVTEHAHHWSDIEATRAAFNKISAQIIKTEKTFGHSGANTVHRAYCSMAFDNTGAEWLQTDSTISNPYFGSKMLRCGEIKETLIPRK